MPSSLGVLTSGGDAPGMNAAIRAIVRTALSHGVEVYAVREGFRGIVQGGKHIHPITWESVGGIIRRGGTSIGTARSEAFRGRDGRLRAARNLVSRNIDKLIVVGGDGSMIGAQLFHNEWPELIAELHQNGLIDQQTADKHAILHLICLPGSIDNDIYGTDMSIGSDTALHRIVNAVDALTSTASSYQRNFVVEVMGRHCGYLALMSALATGADWVLIPESPPNLDNWEAKMCDVLRSGREAGRHDSIVIMSEGAQDKHGNPISSEHVKNVLEAELGEPARVTVLGHVQRGGPPSAFDRTLSTMIGNAAVEEILNVSTTLNPVLIAMRDNRIAKMPLDSCVEKTLSAFEATETHNYYQAMEIRGRSYQEAFRTLRTLVRALPHEPQPTQARLRLAVVHSGSPAPGMNTAVRAAVRLGIDRGHIMLGVQNGFEGMIADDISELNWMSVNGWAHLGGAALGTNRKSPSGSEFKAIAQNLESNNVQGLLVIGGWSGYETVLAMYEKRELFPAFDIPIVCMPATIDNDLPNSELSVGADTALNSIVEAVDKIKQSAVASGRLFIVEVMGRFCGYLALLSGLATGAERVYIHEDRISLKDLQDDVADLVQAFKDSRRVGLIIRNENANPVYDTPFITSLFQHEGKGFFEVRHAILGHLQQGGNPTPFDRIQATRMASHCIEFLVKQARNTTPKSAFIGLHAGQLQFTDIQELPNLTDAMYQRPKDQWWRALRTVSRTLAQHSGETFVSR